MFAACRRPHGAFAGEDGEDGASKDAEIETEGPVLDVIEVKGAALSKLMSRRPET